VKGKLLAIQDKLPERRNLTLISLAFIAYFYGGGSFSDDEIKLIVINVSFSESLVLVLIAWSSLLWSAWRYWLTTNDKFLPLFKEEVSKVASTRFAENYVTQRVPYKIRKATYPLEEWKSVSYYWSGSVYFERGVLKGRIKHNTNVNTTEYIGKGKIPKDVLDFHVNLKKNPLPDFIVNFDDILGYLFTTYVLVKTILIKPSFTSYIFAYLLFGVAVVGAFIN
jgi:hypothetical protein